MRMRYKLTQNRIHFPALEQSHMRPIYRRQRFNVSHIRVYINISHKILNRIFYWHCQATNTHHCVWHTYIRLRIQQTNRAQALLLLAFLSLLKFAEHFFCVPIVNSHKHIGEKKWKKLSRERDGGEWRQSTPARSSLSRFTYNLQGAQVS